MAKSTLSSKTMGKYITDTFNSYAIHEKDYIPTDAKHDNLIGKVIQGNINLKFNNIDFTNVMLNLTGTNEPNNAWFRELPGKQVVGENALVPLLFNKLKDGLLKDASNDATHVWRNIFSAQALNDELRLTGTPNALTGRGSFQHLRLQSAAEMKTYHLPFTPGIWPEPSAPPDPGLTERIINDILEKVPAAAQATTGPQGTATPKKHVYFIADSCAEVINWFTGFDPSTHEEVPGSASANITIHCMISSETLADPCSTNVPGAFSSCNKKHTTELLNGYQRKKYSHTFVSNGPRIVEDSSWGENFGIVNCKIAHTMDTRPTPPNRLITPKISTTILYPHDPANNLLTQSAIYVTLNGVTKTGEVIQSPQGLTAPRGATPGNTTQDRTRTKYVNALVALGATDGIDAQGFARGSLHLDDTHILTNPKVLLDIMNKLPTPPGADNTRGPQNDKRFAKRLLTLQHKRFGDQFQIKYAQDLIYHGYSPTNQNLGPRAPGRDKLADYVYIHNMNLIPSKEKWTYGQEYPGASGLMNVSSTGDINEYPAVPPPGPMTPPWDPDLATAPPCQYSNVFFATSDWPAFCFAAQKGIQAMFYYKSKGIRHLIVWRYR